MYISGVRFVSNTKDTVNKSTPSTTKLSLPELAATDDSEWTKGRFVASKIQAVYITRIPFLPGILPDSFRPDI